MRDGFQWRRAVKSAFERACLRLAPVITVPSETLRRRIMNRYEIVGERIHVVPNGANGDLFHPGRNAAAIRLRYNFNINTVAAGFIGSMGQGQGIDVLKEAMRKICADPKAHEVRFLIAGDYRGDADYQKVKQGYGEGRRDMMRFIDSNGLRDRIFYAGHVSYEESAQYMAACDMLVAPYVSSYEELGGGSPMKLMAYLASGRAVIVSDLGDLTDARELETHHAACLVPPGNADALAAAIMRLKNDRRLRETLAENGRKWVVENRTWAASAERIVRIFETGSSLRSQRMPLR